MHVGDVTLTDVKVGQLLTLEGGVGKSFLHGAASVGVGLLRAVEGHRRRVRRSRPPRRSPGHSRQAPRVGRRART